MSKLSTFYRNVLQGKGSTGKLISPSSFHASFTFDGSSLPNVDKLSKDLSALDKQLTSGVNEQNRLRSPYSNEPLIGAVRFLKSFVPEDIGYLIKTISGPNWKILGETNINVSTPIGQWFAPDNSFLGIDNGVLELEMYDTEKPIFEEFFLPWAELVVAHSAFEQAINYSFLKATFYVDVFSNSNKKIYSYQFKNVYPYLIDARNFDHGSTDIQLRKVALSCTDLKYIRHA